MNSCRIVDLGGGGGDGSSNLESLFVRRAPFTWDVRAKGFSGSRSGQSKFGWQCKSRRINRLAQSIADQRRQGSNDHECKLPRRVPFAVCFFCTRGWANFDSFQREGLANLSRDRQAENTAPARFLPLSPLPLPLRVPDKITRRTQIKGGINKRANVPMATTTEGVGQNGMTSIITINCRSILWH